MRTIMMVDDTKEFRKKVKKYFKLNKIKVLDAPDALEAANILMRKRELIELILLDIQMPEVDGRDVFEIVHEYAPAIPVIVCSVMPLRDQKLKIPRVRAYFQKTESEEALLKKVKSIMGME